MVFVLCLHLLLDIQYVYRVIEGCVDCEICFYNLLFEFKKKALPSLIHCQTYGVYGDSATSDSMASSWARMYNEGQNIVHEEVQTW